MLKSDFTMFLECNMICYEHGCHVCHERYPSIQDGRCPARVVLNKSEHGLEYIIERLKATNENPEQQIDIEELLSLIEEW